MPEQQLCKVQWIYTNDERWSYQKLSLDLSTWGREIGSFFFSEHHYLVLIINESKSISFLLSIFYNWDDKETYQMILYSSSNGWGYDKLYMMKSVRQKKD